MHYKLLALDLDGTLLNSQHTLSPVLTETIKSISEVTHVMIVTGRHHVAALPYHRELGLKTPIICCNGTYIYDVLNNGVISENSIDKDLARQFLDLSEEHDLNVLMYVADAMLYSGKRPTAKYIGPLLEWSHAFPKSFRPNILEVDDFYKELESTEYVWKFVVEGGNVDNFLNTDFVRTYFSGERSWVDRVDFSAFGNTKGGRLAQYIESLDISLDECVAVGDNHNDISMIKPVGLGIAMQNADDTVKEHADMVTEQDHNDEFCLAETLQELFL